MLMEPLERPSSQRDIMFHEEEGVCVCITIIIIFSNLTPDNAAITNIIIFVCKSDKGLKRRERVRVDWNLIYSID